MLPIWQCAEDFLISPPEINSKIGYLIVKKSVSLPPVQKRLFILPQIDLLILQETDDAYILVYPAKKYSTVCIVPKYAKYMTKMIKDSALKKLSFRGGLEVDTMELILQKGEEFAVKKRVEGGYIAMVRCNDMNLPFFIPEDLNGVEFRKKSAFAKFAEKQNAKGLKYFNGTWMFQDKVAALQEKIKKLDARNAFIRDNLFKGAKSGVVVLKGRKVLHGKLKGNDSTHILFVSSGKDYWLGADDVEPLDFNIIIEYKKISKAQHLLAKANKFMESDMGLAKKNLQNALNQVSDIVEKDTKEYKDAAVIIQKTLSMLNKIDTSLKERNEVIYEYTVFPKYVVDYHLNAGNILLKRKFWIKPDQLCELCQAKGEISCTLCSGKGVTSGKCQDCEGTGKIKCLICDGTGWRECDICAGKGYIYKKGRTSQYFFGTGYYYPRYWRPGKVVTSGKNIAVIGPSPVFGGPYYSGTFMNFGDSSQTVKKVCWKCRGSGTLQCPKTRKCKKCKGHGLIYKVCIKCNGKKKLECPVCHSKGFTGKIQKVPNTIIKAR